MKVKRNYISGILLIIATIMTLVCAVGKGSFALSFDRVIGRAPYIREDKLTILEELIANNADLIKLGAFKKLNKMSNGATSEESKKKFILAKLQATVELLKYYGVTWNCPMVKFTFAQGLYYAHSCQKLFKDHPGECLKKKLQLYTRFIFSYKFENHRLTRLFLNKTRRAAEKCLGRENKTIKYINIKIACELKLAQENRNLLSKTAMKILIGRPKKFDCVQELFAFQNDLKEIDSYPGEFYYLIARAFGHEKNYEMALHYLQEASKELVFDSKTRETNKKVQEYYEKMYLRLDATKKGNK